MSNVISISNWLTSFTKTEGCKNCFFISTKEPIFKISFLSKLNVNIFLLRNTTSPYLCSFLWKKNIIRHYPALIAASLSTLECCPSIFLSSEISNISWSMSIFIEPEVSTVRMSLQWDVLDTYLWGSTKQQTTVLKCGSVASQVLPYWYLECMRQK